MQLLTPTAADLEGLGATPIEMAPPKGREGDILPAPAARWVHGKDLQLTCKIALDADEVERLAAGGHIWLTFTGGMTPWSLAVE